MKKSMIVAMSPDGVIGRDGGLPWVKLPGDLARFKSITMGKPCIMGRKTYESIGKPLPGRLNIVVSRNPQKLDGAETVDSVLAAWIKADESGAGEAFIIGGAQVYNQALPSCDRLYLTITDQQFSGDTRLELIGLADWLIINREHVDGKIPYQNLTLERKRDMAQFLTLERLPKNTLPTPRYGTPQSAGIDFAACLTRACKEVKNGTGDKTDFWVALNTDGRAWARLDYEPEIPAERVNELALLVYPGETVLVPLGFKSAFSIDCVLKLYPRSSVGLRGLVLANGTGIVDPDYRGELFAAVYNRTDVKIKIQHGERIVQGVLAYFAQGIVREGMVDETVRGEGGLGSTGQMVDGLPRL